MAKAIYIVILMNDRDMTLLNHYRLKTASQGQPTISKRFSLDFDLKTNHTHLSDKTDIAAYPFSDFLLVWGLHEIEPKFEMG